MSEQVEHTKEIETPVSKAKVVIKTMITGAEREQIENAQFKKAKIGEKGEVIISDVTEAVNAEKHATIDMYVVSIDGSSIECRKRLMKMWEQDTQFVLDQIEAVQKKTTSPVKDS